MIKIRKSEYSQLSYLSLNIKSPRGHQHTPIVELATKLPGQASHAVCFLFGNLTTSNSWKTSLVHNLYLFIINLVIISNLPTNFYFIFLSTMPIFHISPSHEYLDPNPTFYVDVWKYRRMLKSSLWISKVRECSKNLIIINSKEP